MVSVGPLGWFWRRGFGFGRSCFGGVVRYGSGVAGRCLVVGWWSATCGLTIVNGWLVSWLVE